MLPFAAGRVIPGHHTSAPNVATGTTHDSIAVTNALGAAPLMTEFILLMYWASLRSPQKTCKPDLSDSVQ